MVKYGLIGILYLTKGEMEQEYLQGTLFTPQGMLAKTTYSYTATREGELVSVVLWLGGIHDIVVDTLNSTISGVSDGRRKSIPISDSLTRAILSHYVWQINNERPNLTI